MAKKRDYVRERLNETKDRKEKRKARGRARTAMGLKVGDPRTVEHKDGNAKNNSKSNLGIKSHSANSRQGGKKGNRAGKARGGRK